MEAKYPSFQPDLYLLAVLHYYLRRSRARKWSGVEAAPTNAIFWNGTKWNGSEEIMVESRKCCLQVPESGLNIYSVGTEDLGGYSSEYTSGI